MFCFTCDSHTRPCSLTGLFREPGDRHMGLRHFCNVPNFSMQERFLCVFKPMNADLLVELANTVMIFYSHLFLRNLILFVDWFYSKFIM